MPHSIMRGLSRHLLDSFQHDTHLRIATRRAQRILKDRAKEPVSLYSIQGNVLQFYNKDACLPFEPIAAKGPWMVTSEGLTVYDVGGYGMLGFGHNPSWALEVLKKPHVMANVMTPSHHQLNFTRMLTNTIGHTRDIESDNAEVCPYSKFAFLNSGSEAMELALRIADIRHGNETFNDTTSTTGMPTYVVLQNAFHGRTTQAARISHSSRKTYLQNLRSVAHPSQTRLYTVPVNNVQALHQTFNDMERRGHQVDAMIIEPVMGEGNPGVAVECKFYRAARQRTRAMGVPLIVDSVQAGLRTTGHLSCVDYPELRSELAPDMEVFSKAIGVGQFPLSVLACSHDIAKNIPVGIYGNTMTGNPKAMELGYETLRRIDNTLIGHVQKAGELFKHTLEEIGKERQDVVEDVTGTGLLLALHLRSSTNVLDVEHRCRLNGLNVIHGGQNALRFTPWLNIDAKEIHLVSEVVKEAL